uniref:Fibrillar collagen NC1 domain-containing protein n=1 Tax=Macrostomum lignano TaxID=282301 RepID=A0A1I8IAR5_9PLAT
MQSGKWQSSTILRLQLINPEKCAADMLSYRGWCYVDSSVPQNITEAMLSIRGNAQLASFSSLNEMQELIRANNKPLLTPPFKRQIDLKQAARIGMFRGDSKAPIMSLINGGSHCELQPVQQYKDLIVNNKTNGIYWSIREVTSDGAEMELNDCNSPMPSLISFPQTANSESLHFSDCHSDSIIHLVTELVGSFANNRSTLLTGGTIPTNYDDRNGNGSAQWASGAI